MHNDKLKFPSTCNRPSSCRASINDFQNHQNTDHGQNSRDTRPTHIFVLPGSIFRLLKLLACPCALEHWSTSQQSALRLHVHAYYVTPKLTPPTEHTLCMRNCTAFRAKRTQTKPVRIVPQNMEACRVPHAEMRLEARHVMPPARTKLQHRVR
jgi:hypothetical protein